MKTIYTFIFTALLGLASVNAAFAQTTLGWGPLANFGIFNEDGIINIGTTRITGDVGSIKADQPSGFDDNTIINGAYYSRHNDTIKFNNADSYLGDYLYSIQFRDKTHDINLSGKILGREINDLVPGTYSFSGDAKISGSLRLNDGGNKEASYLFIVQKDFNMDAAAKVIMKSGGSASNVFWVVNGQSTVGANAALAGNLMATVNFSTFNYADITMNSGASVSGKLMSVGLISLNNNSINSSLDTDGDGVLDNFDDYPNDPTRAYNNLTSPATIAFEDNWPLKGDYDMNDLVMKYSYNLVTDAQNNVVQVISADTLLATGGTMKNAFGIEFPLPGQSVVSISSGTQEIGQHNAVFMLFSNMRDQMSSWNTIPGLPMSAPTTYMVDFRIDPASHITPASFMVANFNPFIVNYQGTSRREVHLPGKQPTTLADPNVLGTGDDSSNKNGRSTYLTSTGLPWAITLPTATFNYPAETNDISLAYTHFDDWAVSSGNNFMNWYNNITDGSFINMLFIYTPPQITPYPLG